MLIGVLMKPFCPFTVNCTTSEKCRWGQSEIFAGSSQRPCGSGNQAFPDRSGHQPSAANASRPTARPGYEAESHCIPQTNPVNRMNADIHTSRPNRCAPEDDSPQR